MHQWIKLRWQMYTMGLDSAVEKKEIMSLGEMTEIIKLSKISQTQKTSITLFIICIKQI